MRWIVGRSLRYRWLVVFAATATMVFGIAQIPTTKVDVFPEFAPPRVEIQTIALGNSSNEVEELITVPIEDQLQGLEGLDAIRSKSVAQLSSIQLIFDRGMDELRARQLVQERLSQITATLPTWASPPFMMPGLSATSRIMKIGLTSDSVNPIELSSVAYWNIRQRLLRVSGVAQVAIWGERLQQLHVNVDVPRLRARNVTLDQVQNATAESLDAGLLRYTDFGNTIGTGGWVDTPSQHLGIRPVLPFVQPNDLEQVPIERVNGRAVRVGDVADVKYGPQPLIGDAVVGSGPGLLLVLEKSPDANTLKVTKGIDQAIRDLQPGPPGIKFDSHVFRQANFIEQSVDNLKLSLVLGVILVVLVLVAFLFEWRTALISLVAIPLSLMASILVLILRGDTINTMILAGLVIAVGVVVDDAIIDVENIWRRLRQRGASTGRLAPRIILEASLEVRTAIFYATLINVLAVVPVLFLESVTGSFFQPLAISYALAILVSMLVALTVTPALSLLLLSKTGERRDAPLVRVLKRAYRAVLAPVIRRPWPAIALAVLLALAGLAVAPGFGQDLYPTFKERDVFADWALPPGSAASEEKRIVTKGSKDFRAVPGVHSFGSHIGQAFLAEEVVGPNFGENWFSIDKNADYDKTISKLEDVVDSYPGVFRELLTYLRERIDEVLAGTTEPIVVRIYGDDLKAIRHQANIVKADLKDVSGVDEVNTELQNDVPEVEVKEDLAAGGRYGLKPGDVRRAVSTFVASEEVGDVFREARAYDVHVWSKSESRRNLSDIRNLPIDTPSGTPVRLADVARVHVRPTINIIKHEQTRRRIDVSAGVAEGSSLSSAVSAVRAKLKQIKFPEGMHAELQGEGAESEHSQDRLLLFGAVAAIGIFLLLQAAFGSLRLATMFFLTLPMALVGGVLAVYLISDSILSLGSFVGFLAVFGIAARNGILMINHCQYLEREEGVPFGPALVMRGAEERLSPILMTALATALAIIPLIVGGSIPGHEIEHPMAIVIMGGLITSTLVNLFLVPSLYLRFGRGKRQLETTEATS